MTDTVDQDVDISQDDFENEFFSNTTAQVVAEADEAKPTEEDEEVANLGEDDNPPAPEEEAEAEAEAPKKKNSLQERINELTADKYEERRTREAAEKREAALLQRLEALEAASKKEVPELKSQLPVGAPNPEAKDADGEAVYPLGQFDEQYIADLTKFTIDARMNEAMQKAEEAKRQQEVQQMQEALRDHWVDKVAEYEQEVPELRENLRGLTDAFESIEPAYGEYLATTIMASDVGPQIMNYLSQNIGEAQKIVASGAVAATLHLGRLEAKFLASGEAPVKKGNKVSQAPEPPEGVNRGSGGQFTVRPDTDNQEAFEKAFFS